MRWLGKSATALQRFIQIMSAFHLFVYKQTGGALGWQLGLYHSRMVLLTTIGCKTGKPRTVPLLSLQDGPDLVVIASYGGLDRPPAWWLNLKANPQAVVQIQGRTIQVQAEQVGPEKWSQLWPRFVEAFPGYEDYRRRTTRQIPIVLLHPLESGVSEPAGQKDEAHEI
jgi:deazaflavin-dependent oxidoreductase (nitroreductase family)